MQMQLIEQSKKNPINNLPVVRNFRKVIEARDINLMSKELYQFLNLYCGFIAHYNINGFKAVYSSPKDFAEVFIRHFDREHRYFNRIYPYHEEPYNNTGNTKAEIKQEFYRIVDDHKDAISKWAERMQRNERHAVYVNLKKEFHLESDGLKVKCGVCGNEYEVKVLKEGEDFNDFGIICCVFCGQQIKLY
jgi:hypothetical protein